MQSKIIQGDGVLFFAELGICSASMLKSASELLKEGICRDYNSDCQNFSSWQLWASQYLLHLYPTKNVCKTFVPLYQIQYVKLNSTYSNGFYIISKAAARTCFQLQGTILLYQVSREPRKRRPTRCRQARRVDSAGPVSPTCF